MNKRRISRQWSIAHFNNTVHFTGRCILNENKKLVVGETINVKKISPSSLRRINYIMRTYQANVNSLDVSQYSMITWHRWDDMKHYQGYMMSRDDFLARLANQPTELEESFNEMAIEADNGLRRVTLW